MTSRITFLLDRSGSMSSCKAATIEAFNAYLTTLQGDEDAAAIAFSFLQFDTHGIDKVHVNVPVADAVPLNNATYQPRAGTPLVDAAFKTIKAVEKVAKPDEKIVICIQTDGQENESREHTFEELSGLIAEKTELGWEFNFMGAGINAYQQGARMGIRAASTVSYDHMDIGATREAFTASATNAANFSAGRSLDATYSMAQRAAAKDRFVAGVDLTAAAPQVPSPGFTTLAIRPDKDDLDLSSAAPPKPKAKPRGVIDDLAL